MPKTSRFVALDGLRGVAALVVVVFHGVTGVLPTRGHLVHAPLAVDFFFVLSGFVVGYAYDEKLRDGRLSFMGFVRVRMLRLYPMIVVGALLAGAILLGRVGFHDLRALLGSSIAVLGSLTLTPLPLGRFTPSGYDSGVYLNSPEWSLFFELAINFAYAALAPRLKTRHLVALTAVGAAGIVALYAMHYTGRDDWQVFASGSPRVLFSFTAGLLLYRVRSALTFRAQPLWFVPLALSLLVVLLLPGFWYADDVVFILVVLPAFVLVGAHVEVGRRASAIAEWGGRVSYPLYIIHFPILRFLNHVTRDRLSESGRLSALAVEIPVIVGLSWLALVLIDEPVRALLSRRNSTSRPLRSGGLVRRGTGHARRQEIDAGPMVGPQPQAADHGPGRFEPGDGSSPAWD